MIEQRCVTRALALQSRVHTRHRIYPFASCLPCFPSWLREWIGSNFALASRNTQSHPESDHRASCSPVLRSTRRGTAIKSTLSESTLVATVSRGPGEARGLRHSYRRQVARGRSPEPRASKMRATPRATWCSPGLAFGSQWAFADVGTRRGPRNSGIQHGGSVARRALEWATNSEITHAA